LWNDAIKYIHKEGKFTPEMLKAEPVRAMIDETCNVLGNSLSKIEQKIPPELTAALNQNVYKFSACKTAAEMKEVSSLLKDSNGGIKSFNQFKQDVDKLNLTYNKTYLETEYNFAVASAQMAAKWADLIQDGEEEVWLQYRTAGDSSVRPEHQALNGITLPANDPFWDAYYPPNDWGCRCTAVEVRQGKYPPSDSRDAMKAGELATAKPAQKIFRFNPGKEQVVFPDKHPYFNANTDVKKVVNNLALDNVSAEIRKWAATNEQKRYKYDNLETGVLNLSARGLKDASFLYKTHTHSAEEKRIFIDLAKNAGKLNLIKSEPVGERKDLNNLTDSKNIKNKKKRGVTKYNIYSYTYNGKNYEIGFEVIKEIYEQPSYVKVKTL
jgi:SPP1 gp7 family putative phage head morphogenesis protein